MKAQEIIQQSEKQLENLYEHIDDIALYNQEKVLKAFQNNNIAVRHFSGSTGYGYDDIGRDALGRIYAEIFGAESALVSPNIVSGTHTLTILLFGILRPNDTLISISGEPYDTLHDVLIGENKGSLKDFGVKYDYVDLIENDGKPDFDLEAIEKVLTKQQVKAVWIQRSRGYSHREALSVNQIKSAIELVKKISPKTIVMVDNCYGEFVEKLEPTDVGADLMAGSLIKNAGGGFATTGGYIVGKEKLVEQVSYRLTSPSIGNEVGSYTYGYLPYFQGVFMAPITVKNAMKSAALFAQCYTMLGFDTLPKPSQNMYDIVTSIKFDKKEPLIEFCRSIQYASPVDSNLLLEPWDMPGYQHQVIMAAGTFVQGASVELTADAPIKPPYIAYIQGALTYEHAKIAAKKAVASTLNFNTNIE